MPKKRCGFGFDCAGMMMQPGLDPGDCPNYKTCGAAQEYEMGELFELVRVGGEGWERIRLNRQQAAIMMLMQRGCPQTCESLGVVQLVAEIKAFLGAIENKLEEFDNAYIAPENVELHRYNVKRRGKVFWYNKFTSRAAIFEPVKQSRKVKVIHLSHDDDPRCLEAQAGIDRRNRLTQSRSQLKEIQKRLAEIQGFLEGDTF